MAGYEDDQIDPTADPAFQGYAVPTFGSVADYVRWASGLPNQSAAARQQLQDIATHPNDYEIWGGSLRKKSALDFIGKHPWLTTAAFLGGAAAPALLGGGGAAGAASGGGAAASEAAGAGAAGLLPNAGGALIPGLTTAVPASIASGAASAGIPLGGLTAAAGTGAGTAVGNSLGSAAASAGGKSLGSQLLDSILSPQGLATLAGTIGSIATKPGNIEDDPNAKALLEMALRRQQRTDPLHESVVNLANAMLPTAYQRNG